MKFYRIMDKSVKAVNELLSDAVESAKVEIQGFSGSVELKKSNRITKLGDFELERPTFIVLGEQIFNDIETFELVNVKKADLKTSKESNTFIECKYNDMKALYNAKTRVCKVIFEGVLYVA